MCDLSRLSELGPTKKWVGGGFWAKKQDDENTMRAFVSQFMFVGVDEEENGVSSMQSQIALLLLIVSWNLFDKFIWVFDFELDWY